jgi:hypothetical protein
VLIATVVEKAMFVRVLRFERKMNYGRWKKVVWIDCWILNILINWCVCFFFERVIQGRWDFMINKFCGWLGCYKSNRF